MPYTIAWCKTKNETRAVVAAIKSIDNNLAIMGLAGSHVRQIAHEADMTFIAEAFADRRYDDQGHLVARGTQGAVIHDANIAAKQVLEIVQHEQVTSINGDKLPLQADSFCIHGDNPSAVATFASYSPKIEVA